MNPWQMLGWLAAGCTAILLVTLTALIVVAAVRAVKQPKPRKERVL